jgi:sarcosine oxidase subunit gamma
VPEHRLKALTPLAQARPVITGIGRITIAENPHVALASLAPRRGREAEFTPRAEGLLGFALPGPGLAAQAGDWGGFWTGAGQWFIEAPFASHEDIAARLKAAVGDAGSVTEQTDGWGRFEVSGRTAPAMFERLSAIDIHAMEAGKATRTLIEHLGCFVICRQAGASYSVLAMRSAAASLHHALVQAAEAVA